MLQDSKKLSSVSVRPFKTKAFLITKKMKISLALSKYAPSYNFGFHLPLHFLYTGGLLLYSCKFRYPFKGMFAIFHSAFIGAVVSSLIFALEGFSNYLVSNLEIFFSYKTSFVLSCKMQRDLDVCKICYLFLYLKFKTYTRIL